jgi:hypothetical protein
LFAQQQELAIFYLGDIFDLPAHTARNLTYVLLPIMPALFMLIKRRAVFYKRALGHDLGCVQEAFLFDMCQLYPHKSSWCFQLEQMFRAIGVDFLGDIASFPRHLTEFDETTSDPRRISFQSIRFSEEKTLSFFRLMPDLDTADSFRSFLSSRRCDEQNFFLLFFTSGFRWRFFVETHRGSHCPHCSAHFWSWEHFMSCHLCPVRVSVPEISAMVALKRWDKIATHMRRVCLTWMSYFATDVLLTDPASVVTLFV